LTSFVEGREPKNWLELSLIFAVVMGVVGGFLPAVRAARMNILAALRAE